MTVLPNLPADYRDFLKTHDGETEYSFEDIDGWRLYTTDQLVEVIRINREKVPNIFQLSAYAKSLREYVGDELEDQDGEPYSVDRLSAGLAVGDNNGDVIFLDAEDSYSVWMFHHDGADVERLANSFHEWLEAAKPYTFDDENEDDGDEED